MNKNQPAIELIKQRVSDLELSQEQSAEFRQEYRKEISRRGLEVAKIKSSIKKLRQAMLDSTLRDERQRAELESLRQTLELLRAQEDNSLPDD